MKKYTLDIVIEENSIGVGVSMEPNDNGEWVRWEDVAPLLNALRKIVGPPRFSTGCRATLGHGESCTGGRLCGNCAKHNQLVRALYVEEAMKEDVFCDECGCDLPDKFNGENYTCEGCLSEEEE